MAFNPSPAAMWPGYSSDGTTISIPLSSLPGLTAGEANATTGDWREIMLAICEKAYRYTAALATADAPSACTIRMPDVNAIKGGEFDGKYLVTYSMQFYVAWPGFSDVADEPL